MSVTVEELYDKRLMLESSIYNLIRIFERDSGASVYSIDLYKDLPFGRRLPEVVNVTVEVRV